MLSGCSIHRALHGSYTHVLAIRTYMYVCVVALLLMVVAIIISEPLSPKNQSLPLFAIICIAVGVCGAVTVVLVCLSCVVIYKRHKMRRQLSKVFVVSECIRHGLIRILYVFLIKRDSKCVFGHVCTYVCNFKSVPTFFFFLFSV